MNSHTRFFWLLLLLSLACGLLLYSQEKAAAPLLPIGKPVQIKAPLGLPPVPIPADNPPTAETIARGRRLYYDPILSGDKTVSCATCHDPRYGFADPKPVSEGVGKKTGDAQLAASDECRVLYSSVLGWPRPEFGKASRGPGAESGGNGQHPGRSRESVER